MNCPHGHGSPDQCSQCRGIKTVRITYEQTKTILSTRPMARQANYGTIPTVGNKRKNCSFCRKSGHTIADCKERIKKVI